MTGCWLTEDERWEGGEMRLAEAPNTELGPVVHELMRSMLQT